MHGRQELVQVAEVVFAELAGGVSLALSAVAMVHASAGKPDVGSSLPDSRQPVRIGNSPVMKFARPAVQLASA